MRTVVVSARIDGGTPMQLIEGSKYGFRVVKTTGAQGTVIIPGVGGGVAGSSGFNFGSAGPGASDFINSGPGPFPVNMEINRELDQASDSGLVTLSDPAGASANLLVTDSEWQRVPCRYLRISNLQPFNYQGQTVGQYMLVLADSPQEMDGRILKTGYVDDGQWCIVSEFLAPTAGTPLLVQGQQGNGARQNAVCGLTKLIIQNLGPNLIGVAMERAIDVNNTYPSAAAVLANGLILGPAAAGVPASTLVLDNLGDSVSVLIAASTALQVAGAGTRVARFFGAGYRGN